MRLRDRINSVRSVGTRRYAAILASAIIAVSAPGLVALATPTVTSASDSHGQYMLVNNGAITFQLYSTGALAGKVTSIVYDGQQMTGAKDLYYDIQGTPGIYLGSAETYSFRTGSNYVVLSAFHAATATEPLDVTWSWILKDGQPAFSTALLYHHTTAMADYSTNENRLGAEFFNDSLFNYSSITDNFWGYQAAGDADRAQGRYITGETQDMRGVPSEYIKNYETKYDWRSTYAESGGVTGIFTAANTSLATRTNVTNNYGVWTVVDQRAYESWNAGPTHPQTPVADGASIIPSPPGSHFGGPGTVFTGNMDKLFDPILTYFNKSSGSVDALRADATTYTGANSQDSFYDTLGLTGYVPTTGRGSVTGKVRMMDGSSLAGATVILSDFNAAAYGVDPLSQEYQRHVNGYNYWVTPNPDGTFTVPDMIPGTYRLTVIKPGTYREGTWDNIVVSAGGATAVGNKTFVPDINGKGVWQIGTFDRTAGEFKDGNQFNNWLTTFDYTKEFPNGVNYVVNPANPLNDVNNWSQNWGLNQINGSQDFWSVNFNMATLPAANATVTLTFSIADEMFINSLGLVVSGHSNIYVSFDHTADNAPSTFRSGDTTSRVLYRKMTVPVSYLKLGANTFTFHVVGGNMQWDALRMDIQNPGTFSAAQWNGGSGNWSDATQWMTQGYGYTNINKGAATINGVANPSYPNDTSTTFADGATATAPMNNAGALLYYDAIFNGGSITLDMSPSVQRLSLLEGMLNVSGSARVITANDAVVLGGATVTGLGTINALTTTAVSFGNVVSGGFVVNSTGPVTITDGATLQVTGTGSAWNTPGIGFGTAITTALQADTGGKITTGAGDFVAGTFAVTTIGAGGSLTATNLNNAGSLTSNGTVQIGAAGVFTNSGVATINGGLSGGSVVNAGGVLVLNGTSTYTGTTTVNGGGVQFGGAASIGGSGASVTVNAGGAVAFVPGVMTAAFLARLNAGSTGALALTVADAAAALNFTAGPLATLGNMAIGAVGNVTYSGAYTPSGTVYRLGGGGGVLTYLPVISGAAAVQIGNVGSSGAVVLNGANGYSGTTTVRGGILSVAVLGNGGAASALGSSSSAAANFVLDGGTLRYTGAAGASDRLFTLGANGAALDGSGTGGINFSNSGALGMGGTGNRTLTLTGTGAGNVLAAAIGNPATGTTALLKDGTGTWTLGSGAKTYSGDTTLLNGKVILGTGAALPSGAGNGNLSLAIPALLEMNGQNLALNALNDGAANAPPTDDPNAPAGWASANGPGGGNINNAGTARTLTLGNNSASGLYSGTISGAVSLLKTGTGTQILSGDNTYTGTTTVTTGILQVGNGGTPNSTGPGDGNFRGMLGSGNVLNNATLVFNRGYYTTSANLISGTGTVKQIANAELITDAANNYTGPTVIGGGIPNIGLGDSTDGTGLGYTGDSAINASVLANGGLASSIGASSNAAGNLVLDGGTLYYSATTARNTDRLFTVTQNGGAIYTSGPLTFTNGGAIVMSGVGDRTLSLEGDSTTASTFNADVGDPAGGGKTTLRKDRANTWIIGTGSALTYTGDTTIWSGILQLGASNQLPFGVGKGNLTMPYNVNNAAGTNDVCKLEMNGFDVSINGLAADNANYATNGATAFVSNVGALKTLTLGNADATADFEGIISGAINIVKVGMGTQTLSGVDTNTGTTTVNAGILLYGNTGVMGGSAKNVTINAAGALGATGTTISQTFLNRITTASTGSVGISSDSAVALDFSAAGANLPNVYFGAIGTANYSGALTPFGSAYRFGGGGGSLTVSQALTASGASVLVGISGRVIFTATANTYTGGTTITAGGLLQFSNLGAIGGAGANVMMTGGGIDAAGYSMDQPFLARINAAAVGVAALGMNSGNALNFSAAGANVSLGADGVFTYSGILTPFGTSYLLGGGGGSLTISNGAALTGSNNVIIGGPSAGGGGTVLISTAQAYTGMTTLKPGVTLLGTLANGGSSSAIGKSSDVAANLIFDGGTLETAGNTDRAFTITSNGGTIDNTNSSNFNGTGAVAFTGGANTALTLTGTNTAHINLGNAIGDVGGGFLFAINKTGAGKWAFSTSNSKTYSGDTDISGGTLEGTAANSFSKNSNMVIDAGAAIDLVATSQTINALIGPGAVNDTGGLTTDTLTVGANGGTGIFTGTIATNIGLVKTGSGTQSLNGHNFALRALTINGGKLQAGDGITAATLSANALIFGGTPAAPAGTLDLMNNALLIPAPGGKAGILTNLESEINASRLTNWTGPGITSSLAAGDPLHKGVGVFDNAFLGLTTIGGQTVNSNNVIVTEALVGDTNLDGHVNDLDLDVVQANWKLPRNNWAQGDVNDDGVVDNLDVMAIVNNWDAGTPFTPQINYVPGFSVSLSAVPEAGTAGILLATCGLLLRRRRRPRRNV